MVIKSQRQLAPYDIVKVQTSYGATFYGEAMSFPVPGERGADPTIMVRRVPGDPRTLEEFKLHRVTHYPKRPRYVHYAIVKGTGSFPLDMLRYEFAAPVNFDLILEYPYYRFSGRDETDLIIAYASPLIRPRWTNDRWRSFGWELTPLKTEEWKSHDD